LSTIFDAKNYFKEVKKAENKNQGFFPYKNLPRKLADITFAKLIAFAFNVLYSSFLICSYFHLFFLFLPFTFVPVLPHHH